MAPVFHKKIILIPLLPGRTSNVTILPFNSMVKISS